MSATGEDSSQVDAIEQRDKLGVMTRNSKGGSRGKNEALKPKLQF